MHSQRAPIGLAFLLPALALFAIPPAAQTQDEHRFSTFPCTDLVAATPGSNLRVTFLGVSTLLFDDGETQFLTDGFFSRPSLFEIASKIAPNDGRIAGALQSAGINKLAAVIPLHSHYDHAMDAPVVAKRTGATILGSESTANIARGLDVPEDRIRVFHAGQKFTFGRFELEIIRTQHSPGSEGGVISAPLRPPATIKDYKEGGTYSILVSHNGRKLLVGTPGGAAQARAEVVFLSLAVLDPIGQAEHYWRGVWQQAVVATGAQRVIPVHWDNFFYPLDVGLQPFSWPFPDVGKVLRYVQSFAQSANVDVKCAPLWRKIDPFEGLAP
jgi:L-ascorbate metabolism protein UlaG (beta-lactamase superfamily)